MHSFVAIDCGLRNLAMCHVVFDPPVIAKYKRKDLYSQERLKSDCFPHMTIERAGVYDVVPSHLKRAKSMNDDQLREAIRCYFCPETGLWKDQLLCSTQIVIEKQIASQSLMTKTAYSMYMALSLWYGFDKVQFISPRTKCDLNRKFLNHEEGPVKNKRKQQYAENKQLAIDVLDLFLSNKGDCKACVTEAIEQAKKKDDIADTFCYCLLLAARQK